MSYLSSRPTGVTTTDGRLPATTAPLATTALIGGALTRPARPARRRGVCQSDITVVLVTLTLLISVLVALASYGLTLRQRTAEPSWTTVQPVIRSDFADPAMLVVSGAYYAYATNTGATHIQVERSTDLRQWTPLPDALPTLPAWAAPGEYVWAPAVIQLGARFALYYTARDAAIGRQCVGVATSASPTGPFTDRSAQPFLCQRSLGGTIDPAPFRAGAALYLYFKSDGNCCQLPTRLWGQRLSPDGLTLLGKPTPLLTNDQPWEGDVVEAPDMLAHDGAYDLFYSGNDYATTRYAIGYARCQTPLGPCVKPDAHPLLASASAGIGAPGASSGGMAPLAGPGGEALFQAEGATWIAFHAWPVTSNGALGSFRELLIERLIWRNGAPVVQAQAPGAPLFTLPGLRGG